MHSPESQPARESQPTGESQPTPRREVLERDAELSVLADAVRTAAGGAGSVALVMGEAGIGKSSPVEALRVRLTGEGTMLVGYCDDLATPRTLGPFRDLVGCPARGAELAHRPVRGRAGHRAGTLTTMAS